MTRLGDKVPVARLEPARLARIEDAVAASVDRPSPRPAPRLGWLAAGATCAALLVAAYLGWPRDADRPLVPSVATRAGESARIAVGDAVVELGGDTSVAVNGSDGVEVTLARGRIDCEVEPRPGRAPFVVRAGDVSVEVVGTAFSVERGTDIRVAVRRGRVRVARSGREPVEVAAGESWSRSGRALARAGTEPAATLAAPNQPRAEPARPEPPRTAEATAESVRELAREAREPAREAREPRREPARTSPAQASPAEGLPAPSCPDVETCLAIALAETGPEAGEALHGLVHHELFRERDPARAIAHAELYERRFARRRPAEAEAVLWLRVLAHRQAGDLEATRAAARSYLTRHPRGRFARQAARHAE